VVLPPAQWRWGVLAASALVILMLHAAANLLNDYFDYTCGADTRVAGDAGRPGRVLVRGDMTAEEVRREAALCLALAAPPALWLLWAVGPELLAFLVPGVAALYAYSAPPLRLKARGVGEVVMLVVFGPLIVLGAAYAQAKTLPWRAVILSVPIGMVTTSVLAGNNLRDYDEDRAGGARTLAQRIGPAGQRCVYVALLVGQTLGVALFSLVPPRRPLLGLAALLVVPLLAHGLPQRVWRGERIPDIDAQTARYGSLLMLFALFVLCLP